MGEVVLETARLLLRQIREDDLDTHMALFNTPRVMEHLGGVQPREVIANKHRKSREGFVRDGFGFMMAIERASGELVGHCGIKRVDHPHAPNPDMHEIGWLVREDRWRRGYAYEAMRAVVDWGIGEIGAPQLVALTSQANTGSWKLMEKLGMERREDWDFSDPAMPAGGNPIIQYALTAKRWAELKETKP
jgi:RimJ/RimL family protein N-acetyltransferase